VISVKYSTIGLMISFMILLSSTVSAAPLGRGDFERVDFIHYAKAQKAGGKPASTCYKLMGVSWKTNPASYVVNPTNPHGLSESFIISAISAGSNAWDDATTAPLFNNVAADYSAQYGRFDGKNAVVFGPYSGQSNVIAVTSVWYNKKTKEIAEFDMLFNTAYTWGDATVDATTMDLQNIATHEMGHTIGLSDIYTLTCQAVTMYGYSDNGETSKRTLETPDIIGVQKVYGP